MMGSKMADSKIVGSKIGQAKIEESPQGKAPAVCPLCEGTGWKTVASRANAGGSTNDRRVTRCDCQLRARGPSLMAAARIPRRYEHCELSNYDTDFPGAHPSLEEAHFIASGFARTCDPRGDKGLLIIGKIGTGKTHLAVGIAKELIVNRGIPCLFYDYANCLRRSRTPTIRRCRPPNWTCFVRCSRQTFWCSTNWEP